MSVRNVNAYLNTLMRLMRAKRDRPSDVDKLWLDEYSKIVGTPFSIDDMPTAMALLHPEFLMRLGTSFEGQLDWRAQRIFSAEYTDMQRCEAKFLFKVECPFNSDRDIRGKCQADHIWPWALGGTTIPENRIYLCRFHNQAKGSDITVFDWTFLPEWVPIYLRVIRDKKI
jgi:hypothetical protein